VSTLKVAGCDKVNNVYTKPEPKFVKIMKWWLIVPEILLTLHEIISGM
jgi:hypothetical protein